MARMIGGFGGFKKDVTQAADFVSRKATEKLSVAQFLLDEHISPAVAIVCAGAIGPL